MLRSRRDLATYFTAHAARSLRAEMTPPTGGGAGAGAPLAGGAASTAISHGAPLPPGAARDACAAKERSAVGGRFAARRVAKHPPALKRARGPMRALARSRVSRPGGAPHGRAGRPVRAHGRRPDGAARALCGRQRRGASPQAPAAAARPVRLPAHDSHPQAACHGALPRRAARRGEPRSVRAPVVVTSPGNVPSIWCRLSRRPQSAPPATRDPLRARLDPAVSNHAAAAPRRPAWVHTCAPPTLRSSSRSGLRRQWQLSCSAARSTLRLRLRATPSPRATWPPARCSAS